MFAPRQHLSPHLAVLLVLQRGERAEHHRAAAVQQEREPPADTRGADRPGDPPDPGQDQQRPNWADILPILGLRAIPSVPVSLPDMPGLFTSCTAGPACCLPQARCHHPRSPTVTGRPARAVPYADHRRSRHGARRRARRRRVPAREKMISQIPPSTAAAPSAALEFRGAYGPDGVLAGGRTARTC